MRIGPKASKYLLKEIVKAGRCAGEFMLDHKEDMKDKAMDVIHTAISPYLENIKFHVECFNSQNQLIFTEENKQKILFKNQSLKKWIYLRNIPGIEYCNAAISYLNSLTKEQTTQERKIKGFEKVEVASV